MNLWVLHHSSYVVINISRILIQSKDQTILIKSMVVILLTFKFILSLMNEKQVSAPVNHMKITNSYIIKNKLNVSSIEHTASALNG